MTRTCILCPIKEYAKFAHGCVHIFKIIKSPDNDCFGPQDLILN